jgi:hypothetical protein
MVGVKENVIIRHLRAAAEKNCANNKKTARLRLQRGGFQWQVPGSVKVQSRFDVAHNSPHLSLTEPGTFSQECFLMNAPIFGHTSSRQRRPEKMPK